MATKAMRRDHDHRCEKNSNECFETFVDHKLVGTFPDCGWALIINSRGGHRVENPKNLTEALDRAMKYRREIVTWTDKALRIIGIRK